MRSPSCLCVCVPLIFYIRLMRSPCCLCVPSNFLYESYEMTLLSLCLCVQSDFLNEAYEINLLSVCVCPGLLFYIRLMRSPYCLCVPYNFWCEVYEITLLFVCVPPNFFVFYVIRVVWEESRRLVLPKNCYCSVRFRHPCSVLKPTK
jgi:hypothetical protein